MTKLRFRIYRNEPHRTAPGVTDVVWTFKFEGKDGGSSHREVEAWMRCHPNFGELPDPARALIDNRATLG